VTEDPLASVRPALQSVRWQAEQTLRTLSTSHVGDSTAGKAAAQEVWGEVGGAITREFFGRSRPGAKIARALASDTQRAQKARAQQTARDHALGVVHQARQLVDSASQIVEPRFAQRLRRGLADAEAAQRADTILRRVLQVTGRLETYRPLPPRLVEAPGYPQSLHQLEAGLRGCIQSRLSALSSTWWTDYVPEEIRSQAERRKTNRERVWPWLEAGEHPVIEYLGFPDYARIIFEHGNWERAFSAAFVDADALRVKLRELEPIRTDVAHSRKLSPAHRRRLETYADDILTAIRTHP
jgi:Swt1-like HEPN